MHMHNTALTIRFVSAVEYVNFLYARMKTIKIIIFSGCYNDSRWMQFDNNTLLSPTLSFDE